MNTGIILTLAYPETIVMVADEWYSPLLRFAGVGKKNYVRAGHAALVLINKGSGILEYHDFGRYITPDPNGRVRGKDTDHELDFPIVADFENGAIRNLEDILTFLAIHPKLTHGDGMMLASVCDKINYQKARTHITKMQQKGFIKYAAFEKDACNCARFVTDSLIAGVTEEGILKQLKGSKWFTPSTIGNVVIANTQKNVFQVSEDGVIATFKSKKHKENRRLFLDQLKDHRPNFVGTLKPKPNASHHPTAQWLPGIAAGAWFEIHDLGYDDQYRFKRISPYGNVDVDGIYKLSELGFKINEPYDFIPYSNCSFFHIKQQGIVFRFDYLKKMED